MKTLTAGLLCAMMLAPMVLGAELPGVGSAVEVREGAVWSRATFLQKEGRKLQVRYDDGTEEWIMPERLRAIEGGAAAGATGAVAAVALDAPPIEILLNNPAAPRVSIGSPMRLKPATRPTATAAPFVTLTPVPAMPIQGIKDFFICPDTPQIVVGVGQEYSAKTADILVIDLMKPDTFQVRSIDLGEHQILGAANGGKLLLSTPRGGAVTIHLWEYNGQTYTPKANYTMVSDERGAQARWASLQSETRAVIGSDSGDCYLVDFKLRRAVATFKDHQNRNLMQQDGSILAVQDGSTSGLMRAGDFTITSKFSDVGAIRSIDPTGTYAALDAGNNAIRVVRVATGALAGTITGALGSGSREIDLLSGDAVMVGGRAIYSVKTGMPLWEYDAQNLQKSLLLPSGQMLMAFQNGGTTSICLATLPDPNAVAIIKAAKSADFILAPGAEIEISGDLPSIYGTDGQTAKDVLQKVLGAAGHKLAPKSDHLKLEFTAAAGKTGEFSYREPPRRGEMMMGPQPIRVIPSPSSDVNVTLTFDGTPIWAHAFHFQVGVIARTQQNQSIEQAIVDAGRPKIESLNALGIPSYLAPGSIPNKPAALRTSTITPDGFGPATKPVPALVPPKKPAAMGNNEA